METYIISALEEQRRDALVAYYLGQIVPASATAAPVGITTPDDLYEYLLIDNQVSGAVETSRVAQGIAGIQQYINAIYNGMEPGYAQGFDDERLRLWREGMSEYSVWAGYQMIEDYPENYIDPTLRLGKTSQFETLEAELGQSRISEDTVQVALKSYLDSFELVSNLHVVACYVDGEDFKQADYYFFGRQNVEPFAYYWRKAKIDLHESSTQVMPLAWTEWKSIDVAFDAKVTHVRPVVVDGRLHIVWVELGQAEVSDSGAKTGKKYYRAKMAYKKVTGMWSPATLIYEGLTEKEDLSDTPGGWFALVASMDVRFAGDPRLIVSFQFRPAQKEQLIAGEWEHFLLVFDKLFNPLVLPDNEQTQLESIAAGMLGGDAERAQYPLSGKYDDGVNEWVLDNVVWDQVGDNDTPQQGGLNKALELDVKLLSLGTGVQLQIVGSCSERRLIRSSYGFELRSEVEIYSTESYIFWVYGDRRGLRLKVQVIYPGFLEPPVEEGTLWYHEKPVALFKSEDFVRVDSSSALNTWQAHYSLEIDPATFPSLSLEEAYAGAGFRMEVLGRELTFAHRNNYYQEVMISPVHDFGIWVDDINAANVFQLTLNGAAKTPSVTLPWSGDAGVYSVHFGALPAGSGLGYNEFNIIRIPKPEPVPVIVIRPDGGQFLDLAALNLPLLRYVRLNTTFAKELVKRAELSVKSVLSWEAQHTEEPPIPLPANSPRIPLDFKGANGRYIWELFFHVPHLVAHRLHTEFDYWGAENWLHYLFNPLERIAPLYPPPAAEHPYWVSRPLTFDDDPAYEWGGLGDPDAIAYGAPSHYRKAIFIFYLNNLIAHGDMLYRQLTRDTLTQAQLFYIRAASLLGPLSKGRSISRWTPMPLQEAAAVDDELFANFEVSGLKRLEQDMPSRAEGKPWLRLLDAPWFRLPVNVQLLDLWDRLALRLYNLRHNLTLDGKPMSLPLYAPPANPFDLLRAQAAGGGSGQRRLGSLAIIPPYRFRAMLPRVQNAVEALIRYGEQVRSYMELRGRADQEELQQSHLLELSAFTETIQVQLKGQAEATRAALVGSKRAIQARQEYYRRMEEADLSMVEKAALDDQLMARMKTDELAFGTSSGHVATASVPGISGTAFGGFNVAGYIFAAVSKLEIDAAVGQMDVERSLTSDQYRRRGLEWRFQARQAELELDAIDLQIEAQETAVAAAQSSQEQAAKAQQQAQDYYTFLKNRDAGPALYQWLLSQMSTLYFQAYDAVLSMCLATEACWQYEIGDRDTRFISTSAWADNRFGLTAGETLKLGLLQMESAFLSRHERRLELTKTISLKSLLGDYDPGADSQGAEPLVKGWEAVIAQLHAKGEITFDLKSSLFDKDYPGHYLRQLTRVSVSIPAVLGPYEDTRVMLTQQTSSTLLKPDLPGVRYLYQAAGELPQEEDGENILATHIVFNPRAQQQIGISTAVDDHGVFMLDFGDERYLPFEGTGAVSRWHLSFPRHESQRQSAILDSLTDIILHVRYLAVDGGKVFASQVEELVSAVEEGGAKRRQSLGVVSAQKRLN